MDEIVPVHFFLQLEGSQVKIREQELRLNELQHQLYDQHRSMKLMQTHQPVPPEVMVMPQHKQFNHVSATLQLVNPTSYA